MVFDQNDLIDSLSVSIYLTGPYAANTGTHEPKEDAVAIKYNPDSGDLQIQANTGVELTSFSLQSQSSIFSGQPYDVLEGQFDVSTNDLIFKASLGSTFDTLQLSHAVPSGLNQDILLSDLSVDGSLAGGGRLADFTLVFVPEPQSFSLSIVAFAMTFWYISGSTIRLGSTNQFLSFVEPAAPAQSQLL